MCEHDDSRRTFLQSGGCLVLALVASAAVPRELWAQPINVITGTSAGAEKTYVIPAADGVNVDRDAQVILVRSQNHAFAFALSCPHQNAAVRWVPASSQFQCTKHDSKYRPDGTYTSGRATRNMDRFAIRRDAQSLIIDLDKVFKSDVDAAAWAAAVVAL
jgi:nitrite reductase/ring-hydroxylating ferredoxin subunit